MICKAAIPGTRFGKVIFYTHDKDYHIIVESSRARGSNVYCFFNFVKVGKNYLKMRNSWKLGKHRWEPNGEKVIFGGNVLMFI